MTIKIHTFADGVTGKVVIFKRDDATPGNPTDDPVIADPHADITRVLYHSDLPYISVVSKWSGAFTVPARSGGVRSLKHTLFAHGLDYTPVIFGMLRGFKGYDIPLDGSVLIRDNFAAADYHRGRWVNIGSDDTHVSLFETAYTNTGATAIPSDALTIDIYVTDGVLS